MRRDRRTFVLAAAFPLVVSAGEWVHGGLADAGVGAWTVVFTELQMRRREGSRGSVLLCDAVAASPRDDLEDAVRTLCGRGDRTAATTEALKGYGGEVFGFLVAVCASEQDASDSFAELSELVWRKLPEFRWESTLRTWLYILARSVSHTLGRKAGRRRRRETPASDSLIGDVAAAVRTETLTFLKTQKKTRLQTWRDELPEEDRMLLVLRVDRRLDWNDVARVLGGDADAAGSSAISLARDASRLRKRFQAIKDALRERARREGLVGS